AGFHPALRHAAVPRRELGVGTTFNFLGPLAHPAKPQAQAIGCADVRMAPVMAGVFARRGVDAWVFRGNDGLDELTTTTTSRIWAVSDGAVTEHTIDPTDFGFAAGTPESLRGDTAAYNATVVRNLVAGEKGPVRDAVLLNAGAALAIHADDDGSLEDRLTAGVARATEAVDSGNAQRVLDRWIEASGSVSG
ncbi:MAG TPA: anthranilate phosphoribosyltransferase, partial [Nocardioidaceae bacterium]|nr:anthranilate phosphoribosyltransferase [Nocardioidaceae bacterium]